ncbi:hypothetical protein KFU94_44980 [Chloroflexi bacterium TSY]|nr:hypothetical protein [Chloroflexi bacterium TSY]
MQISIYPLKELYDRWDRGQLTLEQLAGQLLQHLIALEERLRVLEREKGIPPQET